MSSGRDGLTEMSSARWLISVGFKFMRVVPYRTITVVSATVLSEASLLLAFLLPLKVIILLGSDGVPGYFPGFLSQYEKSDLIPLLGVCALGFYLVHLVADRLATKTIGQGTSVLMSRSRKITLFENQDSIAERAFQRYSTMLANLVFVTLSLGVQSVLYTKLALLLAGYALTAVGGALLLSRRRPQVRDYLGRNLSSYANLTADVGFLLAFAFMIFDYLQLSAPSVLICIVSLILTRQAVRRSASLALGLHYLTSQRVEISALFFHGQSLVVQPVRSGFWYLLEEPGRKKWLVSLLRKVVSDTYEIERIVYRQLGVKGVAAFIVHGRLEKGGREDLKLVKLFNSPVQSHAQHEATLLADRTMNAIPAPKLVAIDLIEGFQAHVFDWYEEAMVTVDGQVFRALRMKLAAVRPSEVLEDQYKRSRPMLWDRLAADDVRRVGLAATEDIDRESVSQFEAVFEALVARLKVTPLQFVNFGQSADTITVDTEGRTLSAHWGGWSLEPIGSGLISASDSTDSIGDVLDALSELRSDLAPVTVTELQIAAAAYEFARLCGQQRYRTALEVLRLLLGHFDVLIHDSEAA